ncbi:MAG: hypothetical protein AAGH81_02010 [Bacteroidota bacterium]
MLEEQLKKIWQSSPDHERLKFEQSRLMIDIQLGLDSLYKSIKWRDLSEIGVALVLIPLLVWEAYKNPFVLSKIGMGLATLWLVYVIVKLLGLKRLRPMNFASTYHTFLNNNRDYVKAQKRMRDTAIYWYIIPSIGSGILFFIGMEKNSQKLFMAILVAIGIGVVIYFYNRWIIKKVYVPKLNRINELLKSLEE